MYNNYDEFIMGYHMCIDLLYSLVNHTAKDLLSYRYLVQASEKP